MQLTIPICSSIVQYCLNNRQLYIYLEELSDVIGEDIEFDPVAFCMDYAEYTSMEELKDNYSTVDDQELEDNIIYKGKDFILVRQF